MALDGPTPAVNPRPAAAEVPVVGCIAGTPHVAPPARSSGLSSDHGQPGGSARVPHVAAGQGQPQAAGVQSPGRTAASRAAAQRGRRPGRGQRRVLRQARAGPDRRGLRLRARRPGRSAATRRRRTGAPVRPGPHRRRHPRLGALRRRAAKPAALRPSLQWALSAITDGVAFVRDAHQDLLATNPLGRAFYSPVIGDGGRTPEPGPLPVPRPGRPETSTPTGTCSRRCALAIMRAEAGRDPHDKGLQDLVGELSTRSDTFRRLWGAHDVRTHGSGTKRFHHPLAGRAHPGLRGAGHHRRTRPRPHGLHRRTRLTIGRATAPARLLGAPAHTPEFTKNRKI